MILTPLGLHALGVLVSGRIRDQSECVPVTAAASVVQSSPFLARVLFNVETDAVHALTRADRDGSYFLSRRNEIHIRVLVAVRSAEDLA